MDSRGTLMHDIRTLGSNINTDNDGIATEPWAYDRKKFQRLEADIYDALVSFVAARNIQGLVPRIEALIHRQYTIRGLQYAEVNAGGKNNGGRNSIIYFQPTASATSVPALVHKIFSLPRKNQDGVEEQSVFLAVHKFGALSDADGIQDPFLRYEAFGAQLWSSAVCNVEIIVPDQVICHGNRRKWQDGIIVLRPNNRVSQPCLEERKNSYIAQSIGLLRPLLVNTLFFYY